MEQVSGISSRNIICFSANQVKLHSWHWCTSSATGKGASRHEHSEPIGDVFAQLMYILVVSREYDTSD